MSNAAAVFYYDEKATALRSELVKQGGKKMLFSSVKNFKPPKIAKAKQPNANKKKQDKQANGKREKGSVVEKAPVEAVVYPIKSGLVKSFLTEAQLSFKQFC